MRWLLPVFGVVAVGAVSGGVAALDAGIGQPSAVASTYAGSEACERCHADEYASWRDALHLQMTKPLAKAVVEGDFSTHFAAYGRAYSMEKRDGRYFISVSHNGRPAETFEINYTLGMRRFQGYLSKRPDGRIYVLPAFWHNETKRWVDWKEITSVPDDRDHEFRQIWNVTCVNCHATNLAQNFDVSTKTFNTTWTEMGIGCEACHGPGQAHVALMDEWAAHPEAKPPLDHSLKNRELGATLRIFSPRTAYPRQVVDACGYCHGNKTNAFFGFKPGDRFEDYALPFLISEPIPANDPQGEFWPDGRPSRFNRPQALMQSGCFQKGDATCLSCHTMHRTGNTHALKVEVEAPGGGHTKESDRLCTQCHAKVEGAGRAGRAGGAEASETADDEWTAHTHHAADSPGSRCIECHMSNVNWRLITRRLDHTFQSPVPELTARFGVPNACTTCHEDRAPEWAASMMDKWYGDGERRRALVAMAETIYRAGAGDAGALPDVAHLAIDRSHGAPIRASAAEFAGQLIAKSHVTPDGPVVDALVAATTDPEPMVRIMALRSLALADDPRVVPVLVMHLTDPARLARVSAAQALLNRGIARVDGPSGAALARAQDDWAESLRTFKDVAADHATLGWLEASRGRPAEARGELRTAIDLDPSDARAHVYLGVVEARGGNLTEALRLFREAKRLVPNYPNIDRLIAEARKPPASR